MRTVTVAMRKIYHSGIGYETDCAAEFRSRISGLSETAFCLYGYRLCVQGPIDEYWRGTRSFLLVYLVAVVPIRVMPSRSLGFTSNNLNVVFHRSQIFFIRLTTSATLTCTNMIVDKGSLIQAGSLMLGSSKHRLPILNCGYAELNAFSCGAPLRCTFLDTITLRFDTLTISVVCTFVFSSQELVS